MISQFLKRLFPQNGSKDQTAQSPSLRTKNQNPFEVLEHSILDLQGKCFKEFSLFYKDNKTTIDALVFLPHYGLFFGEKILWSYNDIKKSQIERASKQSKKSPITRLNSTEQMILDKLQDVLSFDNTDIERFFIFESLSEEEFDSLDKSFHDLLPKERLIFADDDIQNIQDKFIGLTTYKDEPYSSLKVLGALNAHTLLLPTPHEPFGSFLSETQQAFLDTPLNTPITYLSGVAGSGKTTLLIRKLFMEIIHNPSRRIVVVTPTLITGELFRKELIALSDFAVVDFDFNRIRFINNIDTNTPLDFEDLLASNDLIVFDDYTPINLNEITDACTLKNKSTILCQYKIEPENTISYQLSHSYRMPHLKTIHFAHTKGALFSVLGTLKEYFETNTRTPILIVVPSNDLVLQYKHAIDELLQLECHILTSTFSLQYQNLEPITLSTPEYIYGLSVPHSFVVNLSESSLYLDLALSRASETTTIISEDI